MSELRDGFELVTNDFAIRANYEPGDINQITTEEQWPLSLDYAARGTMARTTLCAAGRENEQPWLRFVAPSNVMRRFESVLRFEGLLQGLGFSLEVESEEKNGKVSISRTMRYPSVERANRVRNTVLGSNGVTAVRNEGGEFRAFDSIAAFINEGKEEGEVWVASDPPYEVHDMADHVLADLVTDQSLNSYLRDGWRKYLARAKAEKELPGVPVDTNCLETFKLFHPSRAVIFDGAEHRENFTGRLSQALFFQPLEGHADLQYHVGRSISTLQSNLNELNGLSFYDEDLLGEFPDIPTVAKSIIERCQVGEAALKLPTIQDARCS